MKTRRGFTTLESIAAAAVLAAGMAGVLPLALRHGRLLAESRRERIAVEELANQVERIAAVPPRERDAFLAALAPSKLARDRLPGATLTVVRGGSSLGERIVLSLAWDAIGRREHPVRLAVWLANPQAGPVPDARRASGGKP